MEQFCRVKMSLATVFWLAVLFSESCGKCSFNIFLLSFLHNKYTLFHTQFPSNANIVCKNKNVVVTFDEKSAEKSKYKR